MKCDELIRWQDKDLTEYYEAESVDAAIEELKQKLENVQASMYADVVDANMEVRRLKRALYKACANWAHATIYFSGVNESDEFKWENMETECLKKAEEYR